MGSMAESRITTLRALWAPKLVKLSFGAVAVVAGYDGFSSQFDLPKLGEVMGMSGNLLPWWGWLLILQAIFVYALFEYVRRIPTARATMDTGDSAAKGKVEELAATVREIINDYQNVLGKLAIAEDGLRESRSEADRISAAQEKVRGSFYALQMRERLTELSREIEQDEHLMYDRLSAGETYGEEEWKGWENAHEAWWRRLNERIETAKWFAPNVIKRVLEFPDSAYGGDWTIASSQFPDPEAVRRFKRHRIIQRQWNDIKGDVRNGVDLVAFSGLSDVEVRRGTAP